jgi:hypothetical protein
VATSLEKVQQLCDTNLLRELIESILLQHLPQKSGERFLFCFVRSHPSADKSEQNTVDALERLRRDLADSSEHSKASATVATRLTEDAARNLSKKIDLLEERVMSRLEQVQQARRGIERARDGL